MALFLIGVGSAVAIWWGLWIFKSGSKRSWARRKEQKRLEELSEKLDTVEAERRMDVDHQEDEGPPDALTRHLRPFPARASGRPGAGLRGQVVALAEPVRAGRR